MDDEIDRRLERLGDRQFAIEPIFQLQPIIDPVGQPFVIDDDQQVEIQLITFGRMRFIDPSAARIAAIENDLLDPALLLPLVRGERQRIFELLEDDLHDALDFASFLCRKMIEAGARGANHTAKAALCPPKTYITTQKLK